MGDNYNDIEMIKFAGMGVAMGPATLIADDLRLGRLVAPFPNLSLPGRSYFAYVPTESPARAATLRICDWIEAFGSASTR